MIRYSTSLQDEQKVEEVHSPGEYRGEYLGQIEGHFTGIRISTHRENDCPLGVFALHEAEQFLEVEDEQSGDHLGERHI